jgi:hypothetical protein
MTAPHTGTGAACALAHTSQAKASAPQGPYVLRMAGVGGCQHA